MRTRSGRGRPTALFAAQAAAIAILVTACGGGASQPAGGSPAPAPAAGQIPLATSRSGSAPAMPPGHPQAAGGEIAWTAPGAWASVPPSSNMRKAQYRIPKASGDPEDGECAVFYFGAGQGGDTSANIERWASQFKDASGKTPAPEIAETTLGGMKVSKVVLEGVYEASAMGMTTGPPKPGFLLLGAIVSGPDANWFFKCTGPKATISANRAAFDAMIASVHGG
jgi:hypothetical protein